VSNTASLELGQSRTNMKFLHPRIYSYIHFAPVHHSYSTIPFISFHVKQTFMRKTLSFILIAATLAGCNNDTKVSADAKTETPAVAMPMPVTYSSSFELGDPKYSAMIVQGSWKDWGDNNMDNMKSWIADTIIAFHSDNTAVKGADSLIALWKRQRAKYSSTSDTIRGVMSVRSIDKHDNWVLVWASAFDTRLDGTKDTSEVQETWRINKDGKADMLYQYDRAKRKQ
jgi:putative VirB-like lipoprotein